MSVLPPNRSSTIAGADGEIELFEFGDSGDLLICAAGNGRPAAQFDEFATQLAGAGFHVVTFNYRGIGRSTGTLADVTLHDFGDDVWAIADSLDCSTVHLLGKAFGNRVMRTASSDRPDRVATITLLAAGGEIAPSAEVQAKFQRYFDPLISKDDWIRLHAEINYAPANSHLAAAAADLGTYPLVAGAQAKAVEATPLDEWLYGGVAPMLVMVGLDDVVARPENGLRLAEARSNTSLIGLPNCGHSMLDEQPEAIVRWLSRFLHHRSL
jgi:pimeloyl-ACP methyl ester carboxylesterase